MLKPRCAQFYARRRYAGLHRTRWNVQAVIDIFNQVIYSVLPTQAPQVVAASIKPYHHKRILHFLERDSAEFIRHLLLILNIHYETKDLGIHFKTITVPAFARHTHAQGERERWRERERERKKERERETAHVMAINSSRHDRATLQPGAGCKAARVATV